MLTALIGLAAITVAGAGPQDPNEQGLDVAPQAVPQVALPSDPLIRGVRTRSEEITRYQNTWFWDAAQPVGYLEVVARGKLTEGPRTIPCTAWLVGPDVIMTAWHCLPGLPRAARETGWEYSGAAVTFGFDQIGSVGTRYTVGRVLESNRELDYALARLIPLGLGLESPADRFGVLRVARDWSPGPGAPLFMVHHAYGYSKLLLKDPACRVFDQQAGLDQLLYHRCDTRGGSSGAPVIDYVQGEGSGGRNEFLAVGLHSTGTDGGLANESDANIATRLTAIIEISPYLQSVACQPDFQRPYCPELEAVAPTPMVVFFDFDRTDLTPESQARVQAFAQRIKADETISNILVVGHGNPGENSASYAVGLSSRRARTVAAALEALGVDASRIALDGQGDREPLLPTRDPMNRRVEIIITRQPLP